ncbi:7099_t:CDS:1, partial [Cetraspora pellucida]
NIKDSYITSNTSMIKEEIENFVKSIITSIQILSVLQTIFSKPQENQIILLQDYFKKIITNLKETIAKKQQTLKKFSELRKQKANNLAINYFLDDLMVDISLLEEAYDYNPIENLRQQFEQMGINQAKIARVIYAVLKSSRYKCLK